MQELCGERRVDVVSKRVSSSGSLLVQTETAREDTQRLSREKEAGREREEGSGKKAAKAEACSNRDALTQFKSVLGYPWKSTNFWPRQARFARAK